MKLLILKKTIKEGVSPRSGSPYKIKSLFVKFDEKEVYDNIVKHLQGKGATIEQVEKFCKPNVWDGKTSYAFGLNCSGFTFDKVEMFGTLDCNVIFDINDSGFVNAKIQVVAGKEKVNSYEPSELEVTGWTNGDSEPASVEPKKAEPAPAPAERPSMTQEEADGLPDLPF